jgi:hypothetical protein
MKAIFSEDRGVLNNSSDSEKDKINVIADISLKKDDNNSSNNNLPRNNHSLHPNSTNPH